MKLFYLSLYSMVILLNGNIKKMKAITLPCLKLTSFPRSLGDDRLGPKIT